MLGLANRTSAHALAQYCCTHSRPQRPGSFWSAPRISDLWEGSTPESAIHELPVVLRMLRVKSDKPDWLRIRKEFTAHAQKIRSCQRFLVLTKRSAASGDENVSHEAGQTSKHYATSRTHTLFVLGIEILALAIKKNPQIEGIRVGVQEIKITQYADDTTVFLKNPESMSVLLDLLEKFERCSGLKINHAKSEAMWLGKWKSREDTPFNVKWPKDSVFAIGIHFPNSEKVSDKFDFYEKLDLKHLEETEAYSIRQGQHC